MVFKINIRGRMCFNYKFFSVI